MDAESLHAIANGSNHSLVMAGATHAAIIARRTTRTRSLSEPLRDFVLFVCHYPAPGVRTLLPKWSYENAAVRELGPTNKSLHPEDPQPLEARFASARGDVSARTVRQARP